MNGVGVHIRGRREDEPGIKVGLGAGPARQGDGKVRRTNEGGVGVWFAEDGDAGDSAGLRRAHDSQGNLSAVGDEQAADGAHGHLR